MRSPSNEEAKPGADARNEGADATGYESLVERLKQGNHEAAIALFDLFSDRINLMVWRLMGVDAEHDDVVQQVFVNVLESIGKVRNPAMLREWIDGVTVNTVRRHLRKRKYLRILHLVPEVPETEDEGWRARQEGSLLVSRVYQVLECMGSEERIVFILYFVEDQTLVETAAACGCSMSTIKRRVAKSKNAFMKRAAGDPVLASVIEEIRSHG